MHTVDDYIATLTPPQQAILGHIRDLVQQAVPEAEQGTSYAMPAFIYKGKGLLSVMVTKKFLSLYPFSGKVVEGLRDQLNGFETSAGSGGIHFSVEKPLPDELIKAILAARVAEIESK